MCVPAQLSWDWCDLLPLMVSLAVCLEVQKCIAESRKLGFLKATKKVGLQAYWNFLLPLELDETHLTNIPGHKFEGCASASGFQCPLLSAVRLLTEKWDCPGD